MPPPNSNVLTMDRIWTGHLQYRLVLLVMHTPYMLYKSKQPYQGIMDIKQPVVGKFEVYNLKIVVGTV